MASEGRTRTDGWKLHRERAQLKVGKQCCLEVIILTLQPKSSQKLCMSFLREMRFLGCFVIRVNGQVPHYHDNNIFQLNNLNLIVLVTIYYPKTRFRNTILVSKWFQTTMLFYSRFCGSGIGVKFGLGSLRRWQLIAGWGASSESSTELDVPDGSIARLAVDAGWELGISEDWWIELSSMVVSG